MRYNKKIYSSGRKVPVVSERSGQVFPYEEMVREPKTGLLVHKKESDGRWNKQEWNGTEVSVPPDSQKLRFTTFYPVLTESEQLSLTDLDGEPLYSTRLDQEVLLIEDIT